MVKLHKPRQMGNWENVLAYSGEEENPDELADDANASDSTLVVSPNNPCMTCHQDAHQSLRSDFQLRVTPTGRTGPVIAVLTDGDQVTVQAGGEVAGIGILSSLTFDSRAGTPEMPTIVVAEPDNTRVGSTSSGGN